MLKENERKTSDKSFFARLERVCDKTTSKMTDYKIIRKKDIFTFSSFFFLAIKLFFYRESSLARVGYIGKGEEFLCRVRRVLSASIYFSVFLQERREGGEKRIFKDEMNIY